LDITGGGGGGGGHSEEAAAEGAADHFALAGKGPEGAELLLPELLLAARLAGGALPSDPRLPLLRGHLSMHF